ncbi:MAG: hypothetical protein MMC23_008103 [Stictis urceolatum]|nr:hypothetical protein [Stictis urceolata]
MIAISNPTRPVYTTILVCNAVGISSLNLLIVGLLSRLNDQLASKISLRIFKLVELVSLVALILAIYAGAGVKQTANNYGKNSFSKAAALIFLAVYIASVGLYLAMLTRISQIMPDERRLLVAIGIACPLILARLIYSIVYDFGAGLFWSSIFGNVTLYLCVAVLEEIGVTVTTLGIGITLNQLPKPVVAYTIDEEMHDSAPVHERHGKGP